MSRDVYGDRHDFAATRRAFVTKQPRPATTPALTPTAAW